ncbi:MAG: TIGR01212 family radical SAM protein [Cyanobacteria bacterium SID2]|nr:TIGR01212 family radical SAM protein [Cyanobacteria bacterium SID2]MBP0005487.1 TIGR01212 family radical SAM protein [Cyanobacteria bacterium SBC]
MSLYTFGKYLKQTFGTSVRKISIDAGFTCPNRDGTLAKGGCIYCNNRSFSEGTAYRRLSVRQQLEAGIDRVRQSRRPTDAFLAYFQSFSNTYAPLDVLETLYDEALSVEGVVGLDIATRPDCIPDDVLDLLQTYAQKTCVWLELGLESSHDSTLERINRGHTRAQFEDAVRRMSGRGLNLCVHAILGLPGETPQMMQETAKWLGELVMSLDIPTFGIKLHHLHIVKGTVLAREYKAGKVETLTPDAYVSLVCDTIERLPENTVIQRFMGDTLGDTLIAPHWDVTKAQVLQKIEAEFQRRGSCPGYFLASTMV